MDVDRPDPRPADLNFTSPGAGWGETDRLRYTESGMTFDERLEKLAEIMDLQARRFDERMEKQAHLLDERMEKQAYLFVNGWRN